MHDRICAQCGTPFLRGKFQKRMRFCSKLCREKSKLPGAMERYYRDHEARKARMRDHHVKTRDTRLPQLREQWRQTRLTSPWKHIMGGAKHRAKVANLPFDLTDEWAKARWTGRCELSGLEFQLGLKNDDKRMFAASIDRVSAKDGYTQDNCRFILFAVNCMRQDGSDTEMIRIARGLVEVFDK